MRQWLYNIVILAYWALLKIASLFRMKARLFIQGRKGDYWDRLQAFSSHSSQPIVWFHTASLGEFEQGRPLIEQIKSEFPQYRILLTFYSPSGYEVRKNYPLADFICYLPLDTATHANRWVRSLPTLKVAFFVKYEFWHHFLTTLQQHQVPVYSVCSIFRENQLFFQPYGAFNRKALGAITHFFVQNDSSQSLLGSIGLTNATVSGDTRFDRVRQIVASRKEIPLAHAFSAGKEVLVMGSGWPPDWELILAAFPKKLPFRMIIAPHEINESTLAQIEDAFEHYEVVRFSRATSDSARKASILLIDNIGMLSSLYAYGKFAYIGGAFGRGLHNTLEAATYGIPVIFGKKYQKFQEAIGLIECKGGFSVSTATDFSQLMQKFKSDSAFYEQSAKASKDFVTSHQGATQHIFEKIRPLLAPLP